MVVAVAVILGLAIVAMVLRFLQRRAARTFTADSQKKLFHELCAAHCIKRSDRRLLKQLAAARGVADPATLFVEPRHFDPQCLPREMKADAQELRLLNEILFG
jgi:hypothetical protein